MIMRIVALMAAATALIACNAEQPGSTSQAVPATAPSGLPLIPLQIHSGGRAHDFRVEVARTVDEQAQGLMFRERLGPNEGMLFPFSPPRPASFWMKNTLIPLDMIFVRPDGTIGRIAVNTVPQSLDPVAYDQPAAAVLEIAGGRSVELGIKAGDRVSWPGGPVVQP